MRSAPHIWALALLTPGCWITGPEVEHKISRTVDTEDTEDTEVAGPLDIQSVEPNYGSTAGGSTVTLRVAPLGDDATVQFDGVDAEVTSLTGQTIVVRTPPGAEGLATVEIQSGLRSGAILGGFRYWPDGAGEYGTIGSFAHYDYVGEYASWIERDTYDYAWMDFVEPTAWGYLGLYATALDTCHSGWTYPETLVSADTGAVAVTVTRRTGSSFDLPWSSSVDDFEGELPTGAWQTYATYDLELMDGSPPWPDFALEDLARTPGPFSVINPNLYADIPPFITAGPRLQWTASNPGSYMVARLERWSGGAIVEEVRCAMVDDGDFTVPASVWDDISAFQYVDISIGRVQTSTARLPHNNATTGIVGVYWVVGSTLALP